MLCSKSYFAAGFTFEGYEADLFPAEFLGVFVALNGGFDLGLSIFVGLAGGRPRRSNDEFLLERIFFTISECVNAKSCMLNVSNKSIIFMLSFRAVFSIEFFFGRLPQMAAIKILFNFYLLPVSVDQVYFVLVLTSTNHKAQNRYPEMVMARNG